MMLCGGSRAGRDWQNAFEPRITRMGRGAAFSSVESVSSVVEFSFPRRCRGPENGMPISGRAGTAPALEPQEAYSPARSTASAGYLPGRTAVGVCD